MSEFLDRRGRLKKQPREFVKLVTGGTRFSTAAKAVGYTNEVEMARRLVQDPAVFRAMLESWQALGITWRRLKGKAMQVLDRQLSREVLDPATNQMVPNGEYDPKMAVKAADIVLNALLKMGGSSIEDNADLEDTRESQKGDLVSAYLGDGGGPAGDVN